MFQLNLTFCNLMFMVKSFIRCCVCFYLFSLPRCSNMGDTINSLVILVGEGKFKTPIRISPDSFTCNRCFHISQQSEIFADLQI